MDNLRGIYYCTTLDGVNDTLIKLGYSVMGVIEILEEYEESVIEKFDKGDKIEIDNTQSNKPKLRLIK